MWAVGFCSYTTHVQNKSRINPGQVGMPRHCCPGFSREAAVFWPHLCACGLAITCVSETASSYSWGVRCWSSSRCVCVRRHCCLWTHPNRTGLLLFSWSSRPHASQEFPICIFLSLKMVLTSTLVMGWGLNGELWKAPRRSPRTGRPPKMCPDRSPDHLVVACLH